VNVDLNRLFNPRAIAVFGASRTPEHPGHMMLYTLKHCGFEGKVYPINPRKGEIMGLKVYESIDQITDDSIDLAIIFVAPSAVISVMEQIAQKRIPFVILVTAGFEELGTREGAELQADIKEMAQKSGIRFVGPNCLGIYSAGSKLAFF
jgi:acyl-CoA synthetase (NDP forming)